MQELRNLFNQWTSNTLPIFVNLRSSYEWMHEFHRYTAMWNIYGAQKAKRKRDWVEVEIGIPETWWRLAHTDEFKKRLAEEVEKGFISMIDILRRNRRDINADTLLKDWSQIRSKFLEPEPKCSSWRKIAISLTDPRQILDECNRVSSDFLQGRKLAMSGPMVALILGIS